MNLQPFYELKERLVLSAAAGTQLMQDDFRLRETAKKMEVFAKASPVFAKISQLMGQLLDGEQEKRGEVLLDLLGLLDAFLLTQGSSQTDGELKAVTEVMEVREKEVSAFYQDIPYSKLQPIRWALTSTGSGRQNTLEEAHEQTPELFADFRIRPLLVKAVGDSYAELADEVCRWIVEIGESMLPLLKKGFCPDGKKEMVRRVRIIGEIAREKENPFYRENLEKSKKDVREALIWALHYSQENCSLLFDLLKTEKGAVKKTVLWSLGFMEGEEAVEFWKARAVSHPNDILEMLRYSNTSYASELLAEVVKRKADEWKQVDWRALEAEARKEDEEKKQEKKSKTGTTKLMAVRDKRKAKEAELRNAINACRGKTGKAIRDMLIDQSKEKCMERFRPDFVSLMTETIFEVSRENSEENRAYYELADTLFNEWGKTYAQPALAAALFSQPGAKVYERFEPLMDEMGSHIFRVLQRISYQPQKGYFIELKQQFTDQSEEFYTPKIRCLNEELDPRWYSLIMEKEKFCPDDTPERGSYYYYYYIFKGCNAVLYRLMRTDKPELCRQYGEYFYSYAKTNGPTPMIVQVLLDCGWKDFNNFLVWASVKDKETSWSYRLLSLINVLPITNEQLLKELRTIHDTWTEQKKAVNGITLLERWIKQIQEGADRNTLH